MDRLSPADPRRRARDAEEPDPPGPPPSARGGRAGPAATIEGMKPRVLVVEDETSISEPLAAHLAREGFTPEVAGTIARRT